MQTITPDAHGIAVVVLIVTALYLFTRDKQHQRGGAPGTAVQAAGLHDGGVRRGGAARRRRPVGVSQSRARRARALPARIQ